MSSQIVPSVQILSAEEYILSDGKGDHAVALLHAGKTHLLQHIRKPAVLCICPYSHAAEPEVQESPLEHPQRDIGRGAERVVVHLAEQQIQLRRPVLFAAPPEAGDADRRLLYQSQAVQPLRSCRTDLKPRQKADRIRGQIVRRHGAVRAPGPAFQRRQIPPLQPISPNVHYRLTKRI